MSNKRDKPVIAIDGPAGAGKSTLAAHLARRFGFLNLETGAMYRALALKAIDSEVKKIVSEAAEFARTTPEPDPAELYTDVYA